MQEYLFGRKEEIYSQNEQKNRTKNGSDSKTEQKKRTKTLQTEQTFKKPNKNGTQSLFF